MRAGELEAVRMEGEGRRRWGGRGVVGGRGGPKPGGLTRHGRPLHSKEGYCTTGRLAHIIQSYRTRTLCCTRYAILHTRIYTQFVRKSCEPTRMVCRCRHGTTPAPPGPYSGSNEVWSYSGPKEVCGRIAGPKCVVV